jgi:hypothetical protein
LWFCCSLFFLLDITALALLVLVWYPPALPISFLWVWRSCPSLSSFNYTWKVIFFSIFVCWWIKKNFHVFGKWWLTMCLFVLCMNSLDIVH